MICQYKKCWFSSLVLQLLEIVGYILYYREGKKSEIQEKKNFHSRNRAIGLHSNLKCWTNLYLFAIPPTLKLLVHDQRSVSKLVYNVGKSLVSSTIKNKLNCDKTVSFWVTYIMNNYTNGFLLILFYFVFSFIVICSDYRYNCVVLYGVVSVWGFTHL